MTHKEFIFHQLCKIRVEESPTSLTTERTSKLAVSNKFGLLFACHQKGFKVIRTLDICQRDAQHGDKNVPVEDFDFWASINTESTPVHIALSQDDLTLAVCLPKSGFISADLYDTRSFSNKNANSWAFQSVRLTSDPVNKLLDFQWNPGFPAMLASCMSDGTISLWEVKDNHSFSILAQASMQATCLAWSPKGKQIVVGRSNGSLLQNDQQLKPKKEIAAPRQFQDKNLQVVDILWLSTFQFVVTYYDPQEVPPIVMVVNAPKDGNNVYLNYEDVCYGSEERQPKYYIAQVQEWGMLIISSATSAADVGVLKKKANKDIFDVLTLDDAGRAMCPTTRDFAETFPAGVGIDYTSPQQIPLGDERFHTPCPIFLILSTDGLLLPFHMINDLPGSKVINRPPMPLTSEGVRISADQSLVKTSERPQAANQQTASLGTAPPGDMTSSFTFGSSSAAAPIGLAKPLRQSTPLVTSKTTSNQTANSNLPKPAFTALNFGTSALPRPASGVFGGPTTASGVFSGLTTASGVFSGLTIGPSTASAYMSRGITHSPDASPLSTLQEAARHQVGKPTAFQQVPAVERPAVKVPAVERPAVQVPAVERPAVQVPAVERPAVLSQPQTTLPTSHQQAVVQAHSTAPAGSVSAGSVSAGSVSKERSINATVESTFTQSIKEEVAHFEEELQQMRTRASGCNEIIGTKDEMLTIRQQMQDLMMFYSEIKDNVMANNNEINELKSKSLECFALLEECSIRQKRTNDPHYMHLLRSRGLDPISNRQMKDLRSNMHYVESSIREINTTLDSEWEVYEKQKKFRSRRLEAPASDTIYRTLTNNHNIMTSQSKQIEKLNVDLQNMRLYNSTSWHNSSYSPSAGGESTQRGDKHLSSLADSLLETSSKKIRPSPMSPEKQAKLKEILSSRKVTPVKSSVPANLSMSKIASAEKMKRLLKTAKDESADFTEREIDPKLLEFDTSVLGRLEGELIEHVTALGVLGSEFSNAVVKSLERSETARNLPLGGSVKAGLTRPQVNDVENLNETSVMMPVKSPLVTTTTTTSAAFIFKPNIKPTTSQTTSVLFAPKASTTSSTLFTSSGTTTQASLSFTAPSSSTIGSIGSSTSSTSLFSKPTPVSFSSHVVYKETSKSSTTSTESRSSSAARSLTGALNASPSPSPSPVSNNTTLMASPGSPVAAGFMFGSKPLSSSFSLKTPSETSTPVTGAFSFGSVGSKDSTSGFSFSSIKHPPSTPQEVTSSATTGSKDSASGFSFSGVQHPPSTSQEVTNSATAGSKDSASKFSFSGVQHPPSTSQEVTSSATAGSKDSASNFSGVQHPPSTAHKLTASSATVSTSVITVPPSVQSPMPLKTPSSTFGGKTTATSANGSVHSSSPAVPTPVTTTTNRGFSFTTSTTSSLADVASTTVVVSPAVSMPKTAAVAMPAVDKPGSALVSILSSQPQAQGTPVTSSGNAGITTKTGSVFSQGAFSVPSGGIFEQTSSFNFGASSTSVFGGKTDSESASPTLAVGRTVPSTGPSSSSSSTSVNTPTSSATITASTSSSDRDLAVVTTVSQPKSESVPVPAADKPGSALASLLSAPTTHVDTVQPPVTSGGGIFGLTPASGLFKTTSSANTESVFSQGASAPPGGIFGQSSGFKFGSSGTSIFGSGTTTSSSSSTTSTVTSSASVFGSTTSIFGNTSTSSTTPVSASSTTTGGLFGSSSQPSSVFGGVTSSATPVSASSTTTVGLFGSSSQPSSVFGGVTSSTTPVSASSTATGGLFGSSSQPSVFGGSSTFGGGSSVFGGTPAPSTGQTTEVLFGQTGSGTLFGQASGTSTSQVTSTGLFGKPVTASTTFGQPTSGSSEVFGNNGTGGLFGLGGKPSAEKANINVFGNTSFGVSQTSQSSGEGGLFGQKPTGSVFGGSAFAASSSAGPAFAASSSAGSAFGVSSSAGGVGQFTSGGVSIASQGFGGFQQPQPQSPSTGGFGASPSFGTVTTFGSSRMGGAFGNQASFSNPVASVFGSPQSPAQQGGFASFANQGSSPTFGALANRTDIPTFGNVAPAEGSTFGTFGNATNQNQPTFGNNPSFGGTAFGGTGFENTGTSPGQSASFTNYRK